jgi:hypothetical protein
MACVGAAKSCSGIFSFTPYFESAGLRQRFVRHRTKQEPMRKRSPVKRSRSHSPHITPG